MDIEVTGIWSLPWHQQSEVSTCVHCTAAEKHFGCLGWDESLTMSGPKGLFMLHVQMCTVSYRGGLELQTQSHRSWWSNWISMRAMFLALLLLLKWPGSNFNTSWYFFTVFPELQVQDFQLTVPQPQLPPQRCTRRHLGKKTALVNFSSSLRLTEWFLGVQL